MRILIAAFLLLPVPAMADIPARPKRDCAVRQEVVPAGATRQDFRRLDRLPRANTYLTVYREVDRCPAPVIARYAVGAPGR